jgi:hypothetical protein
VTDFDNYNAVATACREENRLRVFKEKVLIKLNKRREEERREWRKQNSEAALSFVLLTKRY